MEDMPRLKDRVESLAHIETRRVFDPNSPAIITLRGYDLFEDPTSLLFHEGMLEVLCKLALITKAVFGHTSKDRGYLILIPHGSDGVIPFRGGNVQKIVSEIAARASVIFDRTLQSPEGESWKDIPRFDVKAWSVFGEEDVVDFVRWTASMHQTNLLTEMGFDHGRPKKAGARTRTKAVKEGTDLPDWLDPGTFFHQRTITGPYTPEELECLPPRHAARRTPEASFTRDEREFVKIPDLHGTRNLRDVIFRGDAPTLRTP